MLNQFPQAFLTSSSKKFLPCSQNTPSYTPLTPVTGLDVEHGIITNVCLYDFTINLQCSSTTLGATQG